MDINTNFANMLFSKHVQILWKQSSRTSPDPHFQNIFALQSQANSTWQKKLAAIQVTFSNSKKILNIQVTDDSDPWFLFQAEINEADFLSIKSDQDLLIDFLQFPSNVLELLEECLQCQNEDSQKFVLHITSEISSERAILSVMEANRFRHVPLLSLQLTHASDSEIKRNLTNLVQTYKIEAENLNVQLETTSAALNSRLQKAEQLNHSLKEELDRLQLEYERKLAQERENFEHERRNRKRDINLECQRELEESRREIRELKSEVEELRFVNETLQSRIREKEEKRIAETLQTINSEKMKLEESLAMYKVHNNRLEVSLTQAKEEINKGNEIIGRLQSSLQTSKSKIKLKNLVTLQQERLLDERANTIEAMQQELESLREFARSKDEECEKEIKRAAELEERCNENRNVIEENTKAIGWLHAQLNEAVASGLAPCSRKTGFGQHLSDITNQKCSLPFSSNFQRIKLSNPTVAISSSASLKPSTNKWKHVAPKVVTRSDAPILKR